KAELIAAVLYRFEQAGGESGFPAAGRAGNQHVASIGRKEEFVAALMADKNVMAHEFGVVRSQIVFKDVIDQFEDTLAVTRRGNKICGVLDGLQGILHGRAKFAMTEESVVVFSVAHAGDIVLGESEFVEGGTESGEFIHSGRQDHHGAFIEDDIQFKTVIADCIENGRFVWMRSRDNDLSHAQRSNAAFTQFVDKRSEERRVGKECRSRWSPY